MARSAYAQVFLEELKGLKRSDKATINLLSMLAQDNPAEAAELVSVTEFHLQQCLPVNRLSVLHLIDSILQNAAGPYVALFGAKTPQMFGFVWDGGDAEVRASLARLANFWVNVLPAHTLAAIQDRMRQPAAPAPPAFQPPTYQAAAPRPLAPSGPPQQQPEPGFYGRGSSQPMAPALMYVSGQPAQHMPLAPQPSYMMMAPPQPAYMAPAPPQPAYMLPAPQYMAPPQQQYGHRPPAPRPQAYGGVDLLRYHPDPYAPAQPPPVRPYAPSADPRLTGAGGGGGGPARTSTPPLPYGGGMPPGGAGPSSSYLPAPPPMTELMSLALSYGATLVAGLGLPPSGAAAAAAVAPPVPQAQAPAAGRGPRSTEFSAQAVKEFDASALAELMDKSERNRGRFMDLAFHRSRRLKSAVPASRQWYVSSERWLTGTTAAPVEEAAHLIDEEGESAEKPPPRFYVAEDPSQPECAISGERLGRIYDPDADEWYYENTVMLLGEEAATYGVMDGSIVKVGCLTGGPANSVAAQKHIAALAGVEYTPAQPTPAAPPSPAVKLEPAVQPAASAAAGSVTPPLQSPAPASPAAALLLAQRAAPLLALLAAGGVGGGGSGASSPRKRGRAEEEGAPHPSTSCAEAGGAPAPAEAAGGAASSKRLALAGGDCHPVAAVVGQPHIKDEPLGASLSGVGVLGPAVMAGLGPGLAADLRVSAPQVRVKQEQV